MNNKKFYVAVCHNLFNPMIKEGFDNEEHANAYLFAMRGEHPEKTYILLTTVNQDASVNGASDCQESDWQELDKEMYM